MGGGASRPEEKARRLRIAAARGELKRMRRELPGHAKGVPADVNTRDARTLQVALVLAALGGHTDAVALLLRHGADVDIQDGSRRSALMVAALKGDTAMCELLLQNGADRRLVDASGQTALSAALERGHMDTARLLEDFKRPPAKPNRYAASRRVGPAECPAHTLVPSPSLHASVARAPAPS